MGKASTPIEDLPDDKHQDFSSKVIEDLRDIVSDAGTEEQLEPSTRIQTLFIESELFKFIVDSVLVMVIVFIFMNQDLRNSFFNIPFMSKFEDYGIIVNVVAAVIAGIIFALVKFFTSK